LKSSYIFKEGIPFELAGLTTPVLRRFFTWLQERRDLLIEKGADIFTIQELMGHADLASTRVYTHCSTKKMREAVERLRPGHSGEDRRFR
jgi:integrase